jgi:hypothetical protein
MNFCAAPRPQKWHMRLRHKINICAFGIKSTYAPSAQNKGGRCAAPSSNICPSLLFRGAFCLLLVLALLVCHCARGLASGLARGLALAATAMCRAVFQRRAVQGLDMFHRNFLLW